MATTSKVLVELENKFWQSMVDQDTDAAVGLLCEPAVMVSSHGAFKFDHAGYRKMADQGSMVLTSFELNDMEVVFPTETTAVLTYRVKQAMKTREGGKSTSEEMNDSSTWVQKATGWQCVMHTETPVQAKAATH